MYLRAGFFAFLLLWPTPLQATVFSDDEASIGAREHPKILQQFGGAYEDPLLTKYFASIGNFLAATTGSNIQEWTFTILDDPTVNAFALPGGYVYVTRGLLALANSEAEIASVIGHEIGHVVARHSTQRRNRGALAGIIGTIVGQVTDNQAAREILNLGARGVLAQYSQSDELEADALGITYMRKAGFDTRASARMFATMGRHKQILARTMGTRFAGLDFFASHPPDADRLVKAQRLAKGPVAGGTPIEGSDVYLDQIDGLVYGEKGEDGFVRDGTFFHPALGFAFTAPPGFRYDNRDQAVYAFGSDGTVIIFDGVNRTWQPEIRDYLRDEDDDVVVFAVNGMEAVTGIRRNVIQDGRRYDVRTVLYDWDGTWLWRFRFLSPIARTLAVERQLLRTTHSFRRIDQFEHEDLLSRRIRVITVGPDDTVEALADGMAVEAEAEAWFRILNGIADADHPSPGTRVKIISH